MVNRKNALQSERCCCCSLQVGLTVVFVWNFLVWMVMESQFSPKTGFLNFLIGTIILCLPVWNLIGIFGLWSMLGQPIKNMKTAKFGIVCEIILISVAGLVFILNALHYKHFVNLNAYTAKFLIIDDDGFGTSLSWVIFFECICVLNITIRIVVIFYINRAIRALKIMEESTRDTDKRPHTV